MRRSSGGASGAGSSRAGASAGAAGAAVSDDPHSMQNFAPGGFSAPHEGQLGASAVPHDMQNFACEGFSVPQLGQFTSAARLFDRWDLFDRSRPARLAGAVLRARLARRVLRAGFLSEALDVVIDESAQREQRLALDSGPLLADLGRGGGAKDVHRATDRAPLDALGGERAVADPFVEVPGVRFGGVLARLLAALLSRVGLRRAHRGDDSPRTEGSPVPSLHGCYR